MVPPHESLVCCPHNGLCSQLYSVLGEFSVLSRGGKYEYTFQHRLLQFSGKTLARFSQHLLHDQFGEGRNVSKSMTDNVASTYFDHGSCGKEHGYVSDSVNPSCGFLLASAFSSSSR